MKIYFSRHGESQANITHTIANRDEPYALTANGRQQAEALAGRLQQLRITHIYSSPVLRAVQTSEIVARKLGLAYTTTHVLREYDCGFLEGRSDEAAWQEWQRVFTAWYEHRRYAEHLDGGETFNDIRQRFVPFIEGLVDRYGNSAAEIVCISHGGLYALMLPLVIKNVNKDLIKQLGFNYSFLLEAELQQDGLMCTQWNDDLIQIKPTST